MIMIEERARALRYLGVLCSGDGTDAGYSMSIVYYAKARDVYKRIGDKLEENLMKGIISDAEAKLAGKKAHLSIEMLDTRKAIYLRSEEKEGKSSVRTLHAGLHFAASLRVCNRQ